MPNKALRILIADEEHFHLMKTERLFNQLGYYRVAPVQSLAQMLTLIEYGCEPFDLVLINASLAEGGLDLPGFFLDNRQVRHAVIYDGRQAQWPSIAADAQRKIQVNHATQPDLASIQRLMALVDPTPYKTAESLDHEWYRQQIG
ncbi:response regulator [Pseudomonas sp. B21-048]|uniref:response regulator n=1 Tax=Pseudomonas sp. B21-048 TaxID=2895490 RepID=UPI00215EBA81|nr:response regulator [Pseudomonas sp. B21-048]UVL00330.1 response regulator [Pseudomonas sp. B21-048]